MLMSCRHATDLMTDHLEGRLKGYPRARFALHLRICSGCRAYRDQLRTTIDVVRALPHEEPPQELRARLAEALRAKRGS